jgi:high-affinity nickel-transport protein
LSGKIATLYASLIPTLFAAGTSLVDATDGVLMAGAYDWTFVEPRRKLTYNLAITLLSSVVALAIGAVETAGLISQCLHLTRAVWSAADRVAGHFNLPGIIVIGFFAAGWLASLTAARRRSVRPKEA